MALCENVFRRGNVYWWRGRIGPAGRPSPTFALSLGTRDPKAARVIGIRLSGRAMHLRDQVRSGAMPIEAVKRDLIEIAGGLSFEVDPAVVSRFVEAQAARPPDGPSPCEDRFSLDQERRMLTDFGTRAMRLIDARLEEVRSRDPLRDGRECVDWMAEALQAERINAEVYRLLGLLGTSARVGTIERPALGRKGFSDLEIERIDARARHLGQSENGPDWLVGPERDVLSYHLAQAGVQRSDGNIRRLRRAALLLLSDLLVIALDRSRAAPSRIADIAAAIANGSVLRPDDHRASQAIVAQPVDATVTRVASHRPEATEEAEPRTAGASFLALTEALIRTKTSTKTRVWTEKTARQHRSIAKLLVKSAGTDDPSKMTQSGVGAYLSLLSGLPTHYGKSQHDEARSLDDILARTEDLDDDEIGLSAGTINRHRTQLGTILKHMRANGYPIGTVEPSTRIADKVPPGDKRRAFDAADGCAITRAPPWTGCADFAHRCKPGPLVVKDSLFWVFLIGWYMLLRLSEACGLSIDDIDLEAPSIIIRTTDLRRVKTHSSARRVPIHPELLRLGFIEYVSVLKRLGHTSLFPELHGSATDFSVLFNKKWAPVLRAALPNAQMQKKSFHSTRKTGNSAMIEGKVPSSVQYYIMGHALTDVNGRHYTEVPSDKAMLEALSCIPIITDHLQEGTLRLHPDILNAQP